MAKKTATNPKGAGREKIDPLDKVVYISVKATERILLAHGGRESARQKASAYLVKSSPKKKD
jgi:hypothetical protein